MGDFSHQASIHAEPDESVQVGQVVGGKPIRKHPPPIRSHCGGQDFLFDGPSLGSKKSSHVKMKVYFSSSLAYFHPV